MRDEKKMRMATIRLSGFRSHVSGSVTERMFYEYHSIVSDVEEACGLNLTMFRLSPALLEQREITETRRSRTFERSERQFTHERFCDKELFDRALDRLSTWIQGRREP